MTNSTNRRPAPMTRKTPTVPPTATKKAKRPTNPDLAEAVGLSERQLQRHKAFGMPLPRAGEALTKWAARAWKWIDTNRAPVGPKSQQGDPNDPTSMAHYNRRYRAARASLAELELQRARGDVHTTAECHAETVQRLAALTAHLRRLPAELAPRLAHRPPEDIAEELNRALRDAMNAFAEKARTLQFVPAGASAGTSPADASAPNRKSEDQTR